MKLKPQSDNHKKILEEFREKFVIKNLALTKYKVAYINDDGIIVNWEAKDIETFLLEKLEQQSKEYEEELVRLRTYWKKKVKEEKHKTIEEIQTQLPVLAEYVGVKEEATIRLVKLHSFLYKLKESEEGDDKK